MAEAGAGVRRRGDIQGGQFSCQQPADRFDFGLTIRDSCTQIESVFLSHQRLLLECFDRFTEKCVSVF